MPDHLIIDASRQPNQIRCPHCGFAQDLQLPVAIRELVALERRINAEHKGCKPQQAGLEIEAADLRRRLYRRFTYVAGFAYAAGFLVSGLILSAWPRNLHHPGPCAVPPEACRPAGGEVQP